MKQIIALIIGLATVSQSYAYSYYKKAVSSRSRTKIASTTSANSSTTGHFTAFGPSIKRNRLYIDTAYLLASGVGLGYEYSIADRFTAGPFFNYFVLGRESSDKKFDDIFDNYHLEHKITQYGLKGRLFFSGYSSDNGFYLVGGISQTQADTTARFPGTYRGEAVMHETGYLAGGGFQFSLTESNSSKFILNLAGIYGTGFEVKSRLGSTSAETTVQNLNVNESAYFELSLGILF